MIALANSLLSKACCQNRENLTESGTDQGSLNRTAEKNVLRWAGLAGMIGVLMTILSLAVGLLAPPLFVPAGPSCAPACNVDAALPNFPDNKAVIIAENALYFAAIILFVILFLGLYRSLGKGIGLAPAISGTGLAFLGLALEGVGALPSVAFAHLSDVYHAAGTSDQATLILTSHAVQAIFNSTDAVGGFLLGIGFALFGVAMFSSTSFGKKFGWTTILLSLIALVGISAVSIGMDNPNDPLFVILFIVLPLILGFKLYKLSKSPQL